MATGALTPAQAKQALSLSNECHAEATGKNSPFTQAFGKETEALWEEYCNEVYNLARLGNKADRAKAIADSLTSLALAVKARIVK
jgi:hypothetical protein